MIAIPVFGEELKSLLHQDFNVSSGEKVFMHISRGLIEINTGGEGKAFVQAIPNFKAVNSAPPRMEVTRKGDVTQVSLEPSDNLSFRFRVLIPRGVALEVKNDYGSITITNLDSNLKASASVGDIHIGRIHGVVDLLSSAGDIAVLRVDGKGKVRSSGGSIRLGEVLGNVDAESSGGSITLWKLTGDLRANASGGSIRANSISGSLDAKANGGSVRAAFPLSPIGSVRAVSSGGNVVLRVPEETDLDFDLKATGRIQTDLPLKRKGELMSQHELGKLNKGGSKVMASANGGNVSFSLLNAKDVTELPSEADFFQTGLTRDKIRKEGPAPEEHVATVDASSAYPAGLLMQDGTSIPAQVLSMKEGALAFRRKEGAEETVASSKVWAVLFRPLSKSKKQMLMKQDQGILISTGDFFEGECKSFGGDDIVLSNILLGLRRFSIPLHVEALVVNRLDKSSK